MRVLTRVVEWREAHGAECLLSAIGHGLPDAEPRPAAIRLLAALELQAELVAKCVGCEWVCGVDQ
jgi:hypothetical protein